MFPQKKSENEKKAFTETGICCCGREVPLKKRIVIGKLDILTLLTAGIFFLEIPYFYYLFSILRLVKAGWTAFVLFIDCIFMLRHGIKLRAEHGLLLFAAAGIQFSGLFDIIGWLTGLLGQ